MQCARCRMEFDDGELRRPPLWLRIAVVPLLITKPMLLGEATARYCSRCRRSLNAALFFVVAMVLVAGLAMAIKYLIPEEIRHAHARAQAVGRDNHWPRPELPAVPNRELLIDGNAASSSGPPRETSAPDVTTRLKALSARIGAIIAGEESVTLEDSDPGADSLTDQDRMVFKAAVDFGKTLSDKECFAATEFALSDDGKSLRWLLAYLMVDRGRFDDVARLVVADLRDDIENRSYRTWKWWEVSFGERKDYMRMSRQFGDALLRQFDAGNDETRIVIAELFGKGSEEAKLGLAEFKRAIRYDDQTR